MLTKIIDHIIYTIPCHRQEDRCLKINGKPMRICARCFSILEGYLFTPLLFLLNIPIYVGILCQLPMLFDGVSQSMKLRQSNNYLRVLTGLTSGFGLSVCIVYFVRLIVRLIILINN